MKILLLIIYNSSIFSAAVVSTINYHRLGSRKLIFLVPYLWYVFIQELVFSLTSFDNSIFYNIYRPLSVLVFASIYAQIPFMRIYRKYIFTACGIYLATVIINYLFIEPISSTSTYMNLARGFMIVTMGILALARYFYLDNKQEEKFWSPLIWIAGSSIVFYSVASIAITFQAFLINPKNLVLGVSPYRLIPQVMSIAMYPCFAYAFYLCKKIR